MILNLNYDFWTAVVIYFFPSIIPVFMWHFLSRFDEANPPHHSSKSKQLSTFISLRTIMYTTSSCLVGLLILLNLNAVGGAGSSNNPSESSLKVAYIAIQAWKSAITDDPSGILNTWVGPNVCAYKGVFCAEPQNGGVSGPVVAAIDLNKASLQGVLVDELSLLSHLSLIHLNSNRFSGTVPESFKGLNFLQELDLSNNNFSGSFPQSTLLIPNLIYLDLRFNKFTGLIPKETFHKPLDAILLNNNNFQGPIPTNLGDSNASVINLANNNLTGEIPSSFGLMGSRLKEIMFLNNRLTGCVPHGIGCLEQVEVLDFSFNSLVGHLPDTVSCLNEIQVINFGHNCLTGELPGSVCSLKNLINLTVVDNFISGFDEDCGGMMFREFDFSGNCIPGRVMQRSGQQCSVVPGAGKSCPIVQPIVCGTP